MEILIIILIIVIARERKNNRYNELDRIGIVTNIFLSVLYVFLSFIGMMTITLGDNPDNVTLMIEIIGYIGISMPYISIASIFISIFARKKGKSKFSFVIQFFPLIMFLIMIVMIFIYFLIYK